MVGNGPITKGLIHAFKGYANFYSDLSILKDIVRYVQKMTGK